MANNRSLSDLIDDAENVHKDEFGVPLYIYDKIKYPYQNNGIWEIYCVQHSTSFNQNFRKHISGQSGCKECSSEKKASKTIKDRTDKFIKSAQSIHVNKQGKPLYNYSKVEYVKTHQNVIINCLEHGDFNMSPANHIHKTNPQNCPKCSGRYVRTKDEFISEAQKTHVDSEGKALYDYTQINYIDTTTHINIFCTQHDKFFKQTPAKHLSGQKCKICAKEIVTKKNTMTTEEYIKAAQLVHRDSKGKPKYDYSQVDYKNNHTNITIICSYHGAFSQSPSVHKDAKSGCPSCRYSKRKQTMADKINLSDLIDHAQALHQDNDGVPLYSYKKIKHPYQNNGIWEISCIQHSYTFHQNFRKHLYGQTGCKECSSEKKAAKTIKDRTEKFINSAQTIHVNKHGKPLYNYSKLEYVKTQQNVIINCEEHGDFQMTPANHTHKTNPQKCPKCSGRYVRTKDEFISEAQKTHVDSGGKALYDYTQINYVDTTTHVNIFCTKHDKFFKQTPAKHLSGQKCKMCAKEIVTKKNTMTTEEYIKAAQLVHRDSKGKPKYDYSQVEYKNNHTNITIICPYHGKFSQSPSVHKDNKSGCPSCRYSKGEQFILEYLSENNIPFIGQFTFPDCKHKKLLPFDFKVELNGKPVLIEYQGEHHFRPVEFSKENKAADSNFRDIQTRDKIKKEYTEKHSIPLIELTYKQDYDEIRSELDKIFK